MCSDLIVVEGVSKIYKIYEKPSDRLRQYFSKNKKYYREFIALHKMNLTVRRGETFGIVGRNGSGKSTLLQMICGTVMPTTGHIQVRGRIAALLELGAGFNPEFTGRENIFLNAAILGYPKNKIEKKIDEIIQFSELEGFIDQPVKTYSSGMYARLAFSVAIHVEPEILIVDEALAVGDARFVAKCMRRINDIKESGATIIFVSHDISSIRTLCDRVLWLDRGKEIDVGDVFPITSRYMEYMFKDSDGLQVSSDQSSTEPVQVDLIESLDTRPSSHWGSHTGTIKYAAVQDIQGNKADLITWGMYIKISIRYKLNEEISNDNLTIAFSIKDLKGNDIVVAVSKQVVEDSRKYSERRVDFSLKNYLSPGKYLLVATVEKRNGSDVHYYEYYEGAHYFVSVSDETMFGIFCPDVEVNSVSL
ncbi:ABC transporter ATP-binding protein [Alcaligenes sp. A-TC2]|uniref:ABC transporter ATP-binding protein n=1 Tax=Alcaligenes TaxID=507 RepID=UPI0020A6DC11|nr:MULTISPECIES: ABC transporter ATP-binding protein [Alcaligenes]MCX5471943.1 ABC transporter ATP-binding protein [Alcaligenes nematophilus]USY25024.1 ABC transporter ATP-binding protein [Alcaligenes sp. 1735tsa3]